MQALKFVNWRNCDRVTYSPGTLCLSTEVGQESIEGLWGDKTETFGDTLFGVGR